jgi:hypothetical protein
VAVWFDGAVPNGDDAGVAQRLNAKLHRLFAVLIVAYVVVNGFRPVMDNVDLGWHVAQGRWMVQHFAIYRHDAFNYPNLGHPVVDEYPLFQVVLYLAWSLGWWGPCLLTAVAYATLVIVLLRAAPALRLPSSVLLAMALGLMLLFSQIASPLRPHIVTYLGMAVLGVFLLRHRETESWTLFWPMALLQIAWTNSHSGFVLGPAMIGLFGAEVIFRRWVRDKSIPWTSLRTWLGGFLLLLLACFINPFGVARFYAPFYQDQLESIRAYVGEMEPLGGQSATNFTHFTLAAALVVALAMVRSRGAISFSFLLLAIFFHQQALSVQKAWPVFGLFVPLLVLSTGAFAIAPPKPASWPGLVGAFITTVLMAVAVATRLDSNSDISLQAQWRELDHGRSELSVTATAWLKTHNLDVRLFHRCEDGGYLQQEGFDHGETYSDTGFGKYDEAFIHEVGLVNERPALVPRYLQAYQPDAVVCSTFCYRWPFYLRQSGWRLVFYSANSSVWLRAGLRPDLPTVSGDEVIATFDRDMKDNGRPADIRLLGRNLIALNSMGLENFAFDNLTGLPAKIHHAPWYWEAARFLCFAEPSFSAAHRDQLMREAQQLHDDSVTAEFRAYDRDAAGDENGALSILETIPPDQLDSFSAELLLKIQLGSKDPAALALARRTDCFDLRSGRRWQYLAQAEEQAGDTDAAARAWEKAVFYGPDDPALMQAASAFAAKTGDAPLTRAIAESSQVYGQE